MLIEREELMLANMLNEVMLKPITTLNGQSYIVHVRDEITIPPKESSLFLSREMVMLSPRYCGLILPIAKWNRSGLLGFEERIPSGFIGRLILQFFNTSNEEVVIPKEEGVYEIMIFKLAYKQEYFGADQFQYLEDDEISSTIQTAKQWGYSEKAIFDCLARRRKIEDFRGR